MERRSYTEISATINVDDSRRRKVKVGTITVRRIHSVIGSTATIKASNRSLDLYTGEATRPHSNATAASTSKGENQITDVIVKFYDHGKKIPLEGLFLTLIRSLALVAVPPSDVKLNTNIYNYFLETDVTVKLTRSESHLTDLTYRDAISGFDACATAGLRKRTYSDSIASLKSNDVDLGWIFVFSGNVPRNEQGRTDVDILSVS